MDSSSSCGVVAPLLRGSRSRLIHRAQLLRPLPLAPLDLGGAPAARLRRRRADLPALRRSPSPDRPAHRPACRAQDPRARRPPDRAPTPRARPLARTARLRLSRRPLAPPSTLLARDPRPRARSPVPSNARAHPKPRPSPRRRPLEPPLRPAAPAAPPRRASPPCRTGGSVAPMVVRLEALSSAEPVRGLSRRVQAFRVLERGDLACLGAARRRQGGPRSPPSRPIAVALVDRPRSPDQRASRGGVRPRCPGRIPFDGVVSPIHQDGTPGTTRCKWTRGQRRG